MSTILMPFTDESESFTLGFECGQIWQLISEGEQVHRYLIHRKNEGQIRLICGLFGCECTVDVYDEEWSYLTVKTILT